MKGGVRPIRHPGDMAMFERVDMDVIHMAAVILLIPDQVFPIMALPDAPLPVAYTGLAAPFGHRQGAGKVAIEQSPPQGECSPTI